MRYVVAYESMFGNTRKVAEAIAAGMGPGLSVELRFVGDLDAHPVAAGDLLVVGAPTHVHGLPGRRSRDAAAEMVRTTDSQLSLEPTATRSGTKEWLTDADLAGVRVAAFDTRFHGPRAFTGSAAHAIARRLRRRGGRAVDDPQTFAVDSSNTLLPGELDRAKAWGERLAATVASTSPVAV